MKIFQVFFIYEMSLDRRGRKLQVDGLAEAFNCGLVVLVFKKAVI